MLTKNYRPALFITLLVFAGTINVGFGQEKFNQRSGKVSLITSRNVYVKFDNTEGINVGDTLSLSVANAHKPCLLVEYKSSISCVCVIVNGCAVKKEDVIVHLRDLNAVKNLTPKTGSDSTLFKKRESNSYKKRRKERIFGTICASSNSGFSNTKADRHRMMCSLSLDAMNINESKFSLEADMSYTQNFVPIATYTREKIFLRIQNLAVKYDVDSTMSIAVGRQVNKKISSIGAIDGFQAEKHFGSFYTGILAGSRPDIYDYNFNSTLLQYGAYMGIQADKKNAYNLSTVGFLEQRNGADIDRRYTYFQHSSTIARNLNIFSSAELDIYSNINGNVGSQPRLTNFYLSTLYRINKWLSTLISYDSRKQILYYETYKSEIESLLDRDEARQGVRIRLTVNLHKKISAGIGYSKRFQNSGLNKSDNYDGYITYTQLPLIEGSLSVSCNLNTSNYLETGVLSVRHSRSMMKKKLNADLHYRMIKYTNLFFESDYGQQYFGCALSYNAKRKITLGASGDIAIREGEINYWINARIIKRFQKN